MSDWQCGHDSLHAPAGPEVDDPGPGGEREEGADGPRWTPIDLDLMLAEYREWVPVIGVDDPFDVL